LHPLTLACFRKLGNIARLCCVPSIEIELETRPTIPALREIKEEKKWNQSDLPLW
jgi:hypothetical protein